MAAVCLPSMPDPMVSTTAYGDVGLQPGGYGHKETNPYFFSQAVGEEQGGIHVNFSPTHLHNGAEMQVVSVGMPQSPWSQPISTDGLSYWQDPSEQSEFCTQGTLGGGVNDGTHEGGWSNSHAEQNGGQGPWVPGNPQHLGMVLPRRGPLGHGGQPVRQKRRFCTSFPEVGMCRRGSTCAFAHSREEIRAPLLSIVEEQQDPMAMTDDFFMYKYKTLWCPIGVQHEWHTCVYAHNYQDARRPVSIGYGARLCPYWSKKDTGAEYSQRCPLGLRCPYSHGAKEQLYHPQYFKTVICRDLRGKACPRHGLCAFFHQRSERRMALANEEVDYSQPLPEEALNSDWIAEFLMPPFLPESSKSIEDVNVAPKVDVTNKLAINPYTAPPQAPQSPSYAMQQPLVFLLPMQMPGSPMSPNGNHMGASPMGAQAIALPTNGSPMGSPMASPMGNQMGGQQWVLVPMHGDQHAQLAQ